MKTNDFRWHDAAVELPECSGDKCKPVIIAYRYKEKIKSGNIMDILRFHLATAAYTESYGWVGICEYNEVVSPCVNAEDIEILCWIDDFVNLPSIKNKLSNELKNLEENK